MRIGCLIQARLGSERLPRKVLADIGGWPMIKHVVNRVQVTGLDVWVLTPLEDADKIRACGVPVLPSRHNPSNMLRAHLEGVRGFGWDAAVRVTGDCPFIDPFVVLELVDIFKSGRYDYVANDIAETFPNGLGVEVMGLKALHWADRLATEPHQREHVSPWIKRSLWNGKAGHFMGYNYTCPFTEVKGLKFSVDTQDDLERAIKIDQAKPADYSLGSTLDAYHRAFPVARDKPLGGDISN